MRSIRPTTAGELHIGLAILRAITGIIFVAHGGQKLFVYGLEGVTASFAQLGIPLAAAAAPAVALLEFLGGFALIAGVMTRFAAAGLAVVMLTATLMVHASAGFFMPNGMEFTLMLMGAAASLAIMGAGRYSVDALLIRREAPSDQPGERRVRRVA